MADIANKYSDNITGKFYVDNQCIDCDLCRETAPANFKLCFGRWHRLERRSPNRLRAEAFTGRFGDRRSTTEP